MFFRYKSFYIVCFMILLAAANSINAEDSADKYKDLTGKTTAELRLMRNEIFAKHGYIFKSQDLREYYSKQSWYKPDSSFRENGLSVNEKKQIKMLHAREIQIYSHAAVDDYIWVNNFSSSTVSKVDKKTNEIVAAINVGSQPVGIAVDYKYVWVTNHGSGTVSKIDKTTGDVTTIATGLNPFGIAVDDKYAWVTNMMGYGANPSTLCRIDKTTNEVTTFTPGIGVEAYAIAVDKDFLWIAGKGNYTVYKISKADLSIFASVVVPYPVAIALDDKYVWVSEHGPGKLAKLEKATTALLLEIPVGKYPYTLAVDDKYVWLTNVGDSTVSKVNKKTNRVSVIKGFANPYFGISIDRHHVWVANTQTGTVSVIDKNSDVIVSTITGFSGTYMYGDATGYAYYKQRASHN